MSDRALLFLFSIFMIIASLGASVWLLLTGQAAYVDGLFLLLTALLTAFAFLLYVVYLVRRAMEPPPKSATTAAKSAAPAAAKAAPTPAAQSQ
jgi:hypothetical protein